MRQPLVLAVSGGGHRSHDRPHMSLSIKCHGVTASDSIGWHKTLHNLTCWHILKTVAFSLSCIQHRLHFKQPQLGLWYHILLFSLVPLLCANVLISHSLPLEPLNEHWRHRSTSMSRNTSPLNWFCMCKGMQRWCALPHKHTHSTHSLTHTRTLRLPFPALVTIFWHLAG